MSLPFDISEKLKSVQVRHYVEWLGRDSHCGYGFAFGYDEKSYRLIDELFLSRNLPQASVRITVSGGVSLANSV